MQLLGTNNKNGLSIYEVDDEDLDEEDDRDEEDDTSDEEEE